MDSKTVLWVNPTQPIRAVASDASSPSALPYLLIGLGIVLVGVSAAVISVAIRQPKAPAPAYVGSVMTPASQTYNSVQPAYSNQVVPSYQSASSEIPAGPSQRVFPPQPSNPHQPESQPPPVSPSQPAGPPPTFNLTQPMNPPQPVYSARPISRYCTRCGSSLPEQAVFCPRCGARRPA